MKKGIDYIGVGVGAVIVNESNEILLLLRATAPESGMWTIPGGGVEFFESLETSIVRECREEVGVEIQVVKQLTTVSHVINEEKAHWVAVEFLAKIVSGKPMNMEPHKCKEMAWFYLDSLPKNLTITTKQAIESYIQSL